MSSGYWPRAQKIISEHGLIELTLRAAAYGVRSARHALGTRGLYRSDRYIALLHWLNSGCGRYCALADPFKIIEVDPRAIERITARGPDPGRFQWQDVGKVIGGDWDRRCERFADLALTRALRQRYVENRAWDDTDFIRSVRKAATQEQSAHSARPWRGCRNPDAVDTACKCVDALYESIQRDGYRSMRELLASGKIRAKDRPTGRFTPYDEVGVDIGRYGELLFVDGRHRLMIAQILGLKTIPVRICARHKLWQQLREDLHAAGGARQSRDWQSRDSIVPLDHPDLQDVVELRSVKQYHDET